MKNLKYLLVSLVLIALTGCGDYFFDNKLDHKTVITEKRNFAYTLVDADYKTIAESKAAQEIAAKLDAEVGAESTEYADALKKVGDDKCFNDKAIAKTYITFALRAKYPELDKGSLCAVTYKELEEENAVEKTDIYVLAKEWIFSIYYQETFATGQGEYQIVNVNLGKLDFVWKHDGDCMNANGFNGGGTETWLISPELEVPNDSENPVLVYDHYKKYNGTFVEDCQVYLSEGYTTGTNAPDLKEWKLFKYTKDEPGASFVSTEEFDLSAYKGKKIYIGFRYRSGASAISWKIKNVTIREAE